MSVQEANDNDTTDERDESVSTDALETETAEQVALGAELALERYVQFGFAGVALLLLLVFSRLVKLGWSYFGEPTELAVTSIGAVLAFALTFAFYRNDRSYTLAHEVAEELSKVTWPSREQLRGSTMVVIGTSIVASFYTGALDFVWSWLSDFIYKL